MRAERNVVPIGTRSIFALSKKINIGACEGMKERQVTYLKFDNYSFTSTSVSFPQTILLGLFLSLL